MICIIHQNNKVLEVLDNRLKAIDFPSNKSIANTLFHIGNAYPDNLIIWCHKAYKYYINVDGFSNIFHHDCILASYSLSDDFYIPPAIGYVDQSIYIKVKKDVCYPTWLMSSDIGGIHAEVLNTVSQDLKRHSNFDYFLNALAKVGMQQGLFCYSSPQLLLKNAPYIQGSKQASNYTLFKFVKQHYKWHWFFILLVSFILFEKKFPLLPFLSSFLYRKKNCELDFSEIEIQSKRKIINKKEIDVIIPTIGRKKYLYDVLKDLSKQTLLPKNVIIVEQNPKKNSVSELDYLTSKNWPFEVKHKFIHKLGVCNARNIAIGLVESEWVFFADDDIRFKSNLIESGFLKIQNIGVKAINLTSLQIGENQNYFKIAQTPIFGSGTSMVKSDLFNSIKFGLRYEHGYREDSDFGMQIRNLGEDVVFIPNIIITHLKAQIGGFRKKHESPWICEKHIPKPLPTVMLFNLRYFTIPQNLGYKFLLFVKFYKSQSIKNPYRYLKTMQKRWDISLKWAHKLDSGRYA